MASTSPAQVVTELKEDDVLFGRGAPIVNTSGNIRFRDLVNAQKAAYSTTKCRQTKDSIARNIIATVEQRGGRFLKEIKTSDAARKHAVPIGVKAWITAGYDEIVEKVKQTLRESEKNHATAAAEERESEVHRNNNNSISDRQQLSTMTFTTHDSSGITTGTGPLPWNGPFFPDGAVSSSLLPLVLQQSQSLFDLQQQQQQQQQRYQVLAAALGTATTTLGGIMTPPNLLSSSSHQGTLGLQPSLFGPLSMENCLATMASRDPAGSRHETNNSHGHCTSTIFLPSTDLSTVNASRNTTTTTTTTDEIVHRNAVLAALRRYRQQLEEAVKGQSSATTNAGTTPVSEQQQQQQQQATFLHMTSSAIGSVNPVERVTSSLPSSLQVNEPNGVLLPSIAMTRPDVSTLPISSSSIETTRPSGGDVIIGTVDAPKKRASSNDDDNEDDATNSRTLAHKKNRKL